MNPLLMALMALLCGDSGREHPANPLATLSGDGRLPFTGGPPAPPLGHGTGPMLDPNPGMGGLGMGLGLGLDPQAQALMNSLAIPAPMSTQRGVDPVRRGRR